MKKLSSSTYQLLGSIGLILGCLVGVVQLQQSKIKPQNTTLTKADYLAQEEAENLQLQVLQKLPSFGFHNLMADWLYLQYIQYFGETEARKSIGYILSPNYMEAVVDRDPLFVDALLKLDSGTSIFAGFPQKSVDSLEKSLAVTPTHLKANFFPPYYLWIYKAVNELLFLGDPQAAQKSYIMAAQWAEKYGTPEAQQTAQRARRTAQFLKESPNSKIPQIGAWTMVLGSTTDERTVQRAFKEIKALGGEIVVDPNGSIRVKVPEWVE